MDYCPGLSDLIQNQERETVRLETERHSQDSSITVDIIKKSKAVKIRYRKCVLKKRRAEENFTLFFFIWPWAVDREGHVGSNGRKNILE